VDMAGKMKGSSAKAYFRVIPGLRFVRFTTLVKLVTEMAKDSEVPGTAVNLQWLPECLVAGNILTDKTQWVFNV
jgi:hypothetical protein